MDVKSNDPSQVFVEEVECRAMPVGLNSTGINNLNCCGTVRSAFLGQGSGRPKGC